MKRPIQSRTIACLILAGAVFTQSLPAQSPVTVTVDAGAPGYSIPDDFVGVSIFTGTQVRDHKGKSGNLFSGTNTQLITLFKNAGLHHLRLGATGSPNSGSLNLSHDDIDSLFAFAGATDIKVIYSLHYADGAATAKYVWDHYRAHLDYFAFDNEPDGRLKEAGGGKKNYFESWKDFARSIVAAVPEAKFAGPDASGQTLVPRFLKEETDCDCLGLVTQHTYVGGNPRKKGIDLPTAIKNMLSKEWPAKKYQQLYQNNMVPATKAGLPFRITELDDHVHGVTNASDAYVAALWALDVLHWWAVHGAAGVDFQNTEWLPTDTFRPDAAGNYQINPKAYGLRAFDLGGRGRVESTSVESADKLNVTAYAVESKSNLFVTIINKEYGESGREADVTLRPKAASLGGAEILYLTSSGGNVSATNGVTLGGGFISNDAPWSGKWAPVSPGAAGQYKVSLPGASAAVVRIALGGG